MSLFCLLGNFLNVILNNKKNCNFNPSEYSWTLIKKIEQDLPLFLDHSQWNRFGLFMLEMKVQEMGQEGLLHFYIGEDKGNWVMPHVSL